MFMLDAYEKGLEGERLALEFLLKKGYSFIESRYRTAFGEIDLIVKKGNRLVFVEVKYRTKAGKGMGAKAITPKKQEKFLLAAQQYILDFSLEDTPMQIDVIEISKQGIWHIENAFS